MFHVHELGVHHSPEQMHQTEVPCVKSVQRYITLRHQHQPTFVLCYFMLKMRSDLNMSSQNFSIRNFPFLSQKLIEKWKRTDRLTNDIYSLMRLLWKLQETFVCSLYDRSGCSRQAYSPGMFMALPSVFDRLYIKLT